MTDPCCLIEEVLPITCRAALDRAVKANRQFNGAHWADVVDILVDCDAFLEIRELMFDEPWVKDHDPTWMAVATITYIHVVPGIELPHQWVADNSEAVEGAVRAMEAELERATRIAEGSPGRRSGW